MFDFKGKISSCKSKIMALPVVASTTLMLATNCYAADEVATAMGTALGTVKTDMMSVIAVVAPVGIAIAGVILVWKRGIGLFKTVSKG